MLRFSRCRASLLALLAAGLALPSGAETSPAAVSPPAAADFELATATGRVALHEMRGKVVLIDFWASWCLPCRQSFPWLGSLAGRYAASDFVVVAINLDKRRDLAESFLREFAPRFAVAFDPAGKTAEEYSVTAMPSSFLVGREGQLLSTHAGFDLDAAAALEKKIQEAIAQ